MRMEFIGILLIFIGILLILLSAAEGKFAFVGFIGPIPIGFGNDTKLLKILLIISALIMIVFLLGVKHG